jgi:hypothetical protein
MEPCYVYQMRSLVVLKNWLAYLLVFLACDWLESRPWHRFSGNQSAPRWIW